MTQLKYVLVGLAFAVGVLPAMPVRAEQVPTGTQSLTNTCEQRDKSLADHITRKQSIHDSLNLRQATYESKATTVIANAKTQGIDSSALSTALAQTKVNAANVEAAYQVMTGIWKSYVGEACSMTAKDWATAVNYKTPASKTFEAAGAAATAYLKAVANPALYTLVAKTNTKF